MKKIISYLIAVMMVITMMPYTAFAAASENNAEPAVENYSWTNPITEDVEITEKESAEDYSVGTFSTRETIYTDVKAAGEFIRPYLENRITTFVVKYKLPNTFATPEEAKAARSEVVHGIMNAASAHTGVSAQGDAIRWGRHGWEASTSYYTYSTHFSMTITYTVEYLHDMDQELELVDAIDELKSNLDIDGKTDYEKVKAIYDYMTANITYDYENLEDKTYLLKHSAYAALIHKTCVCQGYAVLFYRLALEYGIDSRVIYGIGNGGEHAWNIVKLGNKYYYLDATWDAPRAQLGLDYEYFLKPDLDDHTVDSEYLTAEFEAAYPIADKEYGGCESHTPEIIPAVAATCTTSGLTEGSYCTNCGIILQAQTEITSPGHSFDSGVITKEPTTEETGVTTYTCTKCGENKTEDIPKLEPEPEIVLTEILMSTNVLDLNCGESDELEAYKIPVETTNTDDITWTSSDSSVATVDSEGVVAAAGEGTAIITAAVGDIKATCEVTVSHDWGVWEVWKAATCKDGLSKRYCNACYTSEEKVIPATGNHDWGEWIPETSYTCVDRDAYRYCSDCSKREKTVVPATTDHEWGDWTEYEKADCENKGADIRTCSYCGKQEYKPVPAKGHNFEHSIIEAACYVQGCDKYTCTDCGYYYCDNYGPQGEHEWGEWIETPANCETHGERHAWCELCGEWRSEIIEILPHEYEVIETVNTTCAVDGYIVYKCANCGHTYQLDGMPATGDHDFGEQAVVIKKATCTTDGLKQIECYTCGATKEITIPKYGHKWESFYTIDKKATTKAAGSKSKHCATCNTVKSGSKVTIAKISKTTVNTLVYNGKNRTQNVTVVNSKGKKLVKGTDFTVTYKNAKGTKVVTPKNVGTYKAVIKFKGMYSGTVTKTFKINPQATKITKLTKNGKNQFTVKWTKKTVQVTGYQIRYSSKQNMSNAKTVTVKNAKTTSKTIKQLKAKKKYYVQIRTYKTVNGTKYYSAWSGKKYVTTK